MSKPSQLAAAGEALETIPGDALIVITTQPTQSSPAQSVAIRLERLAGVVTPPDAANDAALAIAARDAALGHADAADDARAAAVSAKEGTEQVQAETENLRAAAASAATAAADAASAADAARTAAVVARATAENAATFADSARAAAVVARDQAQAAKLAVDGKAGDVETARAAAAGAATAAGGARDQAVVARDAAIAAAQASAAQAASAVADALEEQATVAAAAAESAGTAADAAAIAAGESQTAATTAAEAHAAALTAQENAEAAASAAGTAQVSAESARDAAGVAKGQAENAVTTAVSARDAAVAARDQAQAAKLAVDGKAGDVETARAIAAGAATAAETARDQAVAARELAVAAASAAANAAATAVSDALDAKLATAAGAAEQAGGAATAAAIAATNSGNAATEAAAARAAALAAKDQASAAAGTAGTATTFAAAARDAAIAARDVASAAGDAAEAARDSARDARDAAAASVAAIEGIADQVTAARVAASLARDQAVSARLVAGNEADRAEAAALAADLARDDAIGVRDQVLDAAEDTSAYRASAATDRNAAEAARESAEDYAALAVSSYAGAADQATRSETARGGAEAARDETYAARDITVAARDVTVAARDLVVSARADVEERAATVVNAALAALTAGHLHLTIAAGIADTMVGEQFWAIAGSGAELIYATHLAGGTADTLITLAGALRVEQGLAEEEAARVTRDDELAGRIDVNDASIVKIIADAVFDRLRGERVALNGGPDLDVEDEEVFYIRGGRAAAGVSTLGDLLGYGLDFKWAKDFEGDHRLAIVNEEDLTTFAIEDDGKVFIVLSDAAKALLGSGNIDPLDVPAYLFEGDAFGASQLTTTLNRVLSADEGQTYAYIYRSNGAPMAAIREGREPFEGTLAYGQSLRVGGGANGVTDPNQNAVITKTPLRRHLNLMLSDGIRGPMSTAWSPGNATDFAPAIDTYVSAANVGETGLTSYMRYRSLRQIATGRVQTPLIARTDGKGGTPLEELVKGSIPYANAMKSLRRMAEISCEIYGRPFVSRVVLFGHGNANRAGGTTRADYTAMLIQLALDFNDDILALLGEFASEYPELYANVTLPTRIPMLSSQLTDIISSTGDSADDIIFAHVDAAEESDLFYISHPQYFYRGDCGYVDAAHLYPLGYDLQGEYDALAYERVIWRGEASASLMPVRSGIHRDGNNRIVVPTIGRLGALRINTDLPIAAGWGFTWSGAGAVTGIAFDGDDILISGTTGPGVLTYGNKHQAIAAANGSYTYGNVSDTCPAESLVTGGKLTNHLVAFDHTLA